MYIVIGEPINFTHFSNGTHLLKKKPVVDVLFSDIGHSDLHKLPTTNGHPVKYTGWSHGLWCGTTNPDICTTTSAVWTTTGLHTSPADAKYAGTLF